jgi:hypothetical protein
MNSAGNDRLIGVTFKDAASDIILSLVRDGLEQIGFKVESGRKSAHKIRLPVMFGKGGKPMQSFHADAYHEAVGFVLEVEAGRAVTHYQFLKDPFEASVWWMRTIWA